MAIALGTNAGFLLSTTSSPSADPSGVAANPTDTYAFALKDTAITGATKVTEIGWWADSATEEANFEVGIYTDNAGDGEPEAVVGALSQTNAKGTSSGWKKVTGLNIPITAETDYWIVIQLDDTTTQTDSDTSYTGGNGYARLNAATTLPDPWGTSDYKSPVDYILSIYAVTDAVPSGRTKVEMLGNCS